MRRPPSETVDVVLVVGIVVIVVVMRVVVVMSVEADGGRYPLLPMVIACVLKEYTLSKQ